jgi:hypothetical protein
MDEQAFKDRFESTYRARYEGQTPTNFTSLDFISALGSISSALLYSKLFLPEFSEVDGMVFLKDLLDDAGGSEGVKQLLIKLGNDSILVEKAINCVQINLSFPTRVREDIDGDDRLLAEELANAWRVVLRDRYPSRQFVLEVLDEDGEATIRFHQAIGVCLTEAGKLGRSI